MRFKPRWAAPVDVVVGFAYNILNRTNLIELGRVPVCGQCCVIGDVDTGVKSVIAIPGSC